MAKTRERNLFFGFGGVALADILANGVVVLLVVIILTLSIRKQQAEQEIEQSAEISAILARDIASSLVFNDLPSSPPAVLHNYNCVSPWRNEYERHDCQPWLYPVIELHSTYVRELTSNRIFYKETLLQENNEFDTYLRLLPLIVRERVRADIYDLDLYYLAISIMKENGARPNHWHFVGEDFQSPEALDYSQNENREESSPGEQNISSQLGEEDTTRTEQDGQEAQAEQEGQGENTGQQQANELPIVPDDVSLREAARIDELLPPGSTLDRGGEQRLENNEAREQLDLAFGQSDGEGDFGDELAEALAEALLEERGGTGDEFGRPSSVSIRFPGAGQQESEGGEGSEANQLFNVPFQSIQDALPSADGEKIDYHTFMIILMMEYLKTSSAIGFDRITLQDILAQMIRGQIDITTHPLLPFALELRDAMEIAFEEIDQSMIINALECNNCLSKLWMNSNQPLKELVLQSMQVQAFNKEADIINMRLRLYPYPDEGDETELLRGDSLLMHPDSIKSDGKGWYATAIVDPNLSDLVVGYIYGEVIDGDFYAEGDVNSVRIDQQPLLSNLPFFPLRREVILGILYGLLSLSILAVFFYMVVGGLRKRQYAQ